MSCTRSLVCAVAPDLEGTIADHLELAASPAPPISAIDAVIRAAGRAVGVPSMRTTQVAATKGVLQGLDVWAILPTGFGKTLIPAVLPLILRKLGIIVYPARAVIDDHAGFMRAVGLRAVVLGAESGMTADAARRLALPTTTHLLCTIEQLANPAVLAALAARDVGFLCCDEAHCAWTWAGIKADAYRRVASFRQRVGWPPLLLLSATAPPSTALAVSKIVGSYHVNQLSKALTIRVPPNRPNVSINITKTTRPGASHGTVLEPRELPTLLLNTIQGLKAAALEGGDRLATYPRVIVFCSSQASAVQFFNCAVCIIGGGVLPGNLLKTFTLYTGSTDTAQRDAILLRVHRPRSRLRMVIATSAFGMGVNIPNVDAVYHWGVPATLADFAQEGGRAGRDGRLAEHHVFFCGRDLGKRPEEVKAFFNSTACLRRQLLCHLHGCPDTALDGELDLAGLPLVADDASCCSNCSRSTDADT